MGDFVLVVLVHLGIGMRRGSTRRLVRSTGFKDGIPAEQWASSSTSSNDGSMGSSFKDDRLHIRRGCEGEDALGVGGAVIKSVEHLVQSNMSAALQKPLTKKENRMKNKLRQYFDRLTITLHTQLIQNEHVRSGKASQGSETQ